jgi:hypothetical protein
MRRLLTCVAMLVLSVAGCGLWLFAQGAPDGQVPAADGAFKQLIKEETDLYVNNVKKNRADLTSVVQKIYEARKQKRIELLAGNKSPDEETMKKINDELAAVSEGFRVEASDIVGKLFDEEMRHRESVLKIAQNNRGAMVSEMVDNLLNGKMPVGGLADGRGSAEGEAPVQGPTKPAKRDTRRPGGDDDTQIE